MVAVQVVDGELAAGELAIVVGVATTALGLSLVVRIKDTFGTIEESEIEDASL